MYREFIITLIFNINLVRVGIIMELLLNNFQYLKVNSSNKISYGSMVIKVPDWVLE
jgi:hypothetical protein